MTESFNEYERDFLALTSQLPGRVTALTQYGDNAEQANADIRRIDSDLTQAKQKLNDMVMEARGVMEPTKRELGNKIVMYRTNIEGITADLNKARAKYQRSALMGGGSAGRGPLDFDKSTDQRTRMMESTDKLRGGTDVLNDAHRTLESTLEVGTGVMDELSRNRETLQRVRGNVGIVGGSLDEARRILRSMGRREVRTKVALVIFSICVIGVIIGLIVYMNRPTTAPST